MCENHAYCLALKFQSFKGWNSVDILSSFSTNQSHFCCFSYVSDTTFMFWCTFIFSEICDFSHIWPKIQQFVSKLIPNFFFMIEISYQLLSIWKSVFVVFFFFFFELHLSLKINRWVTWSLHPCGSSVFESSTSRNIAGTAWYCSVYYWKKSMSVFIPDTRSAGEGPAWHRRTHSRCRSISGSGRCPGERNGSPLLYSCLENSMDGGSWRETVHGVSKELGRTEHTHPLHLALSLRDIFSGEFHTPNCYLFYCKAVI